MVLFPLELSLGRSVRVWRGGMAVNLGGRWPCRPVVEADRPPGFAAVILLGGCLVSAVYKLQGLGEGGGALSPLPRLNFERTGLRRWRTGHWSRGRGNECASEGEAEGRCPSLDSPVFGRQARTSRQRSNHSEAGERERGRERKHKEETCRVQHRRPGAGKRVDLIDNGRGRGAGEWVGDDDLDRSQLLSRTTTQKREVLQDALTAIISSRQLLSLRRPPWPRRARMPSDTAASNSYR